MAFTTSGPNWILATCFFIVTAIITSHLTNGQCPWPKNLTQLNTACACSYVQSKLSVQCSAVNMTKLLTTLRESEEKLPLELLQVSNSSLPHLTDDSFYNLRISTIKFQKCDISNISSNAFRDLEDVLLSLNLPDNRLSETMLPNLRNLRALTSLDISNNNIQQLPDDAFRGLNLDTLNLMENNVTTISPGSFKSLEKTLKNLNLKGCGLKTLPDAIRNLTSLAFLDLAQNKIQNVSSGFFTNMKSLTALSLEKNQIQHLEVNAFAGLENSMSSLSLLNNQFDHMPTEAVTILKELRVLDLGFNKLSTIPDKAFRNITSLTLLALDGNPLSTLPFHAFQHLKTTLRGLSVGSRSFICDCNIRWIAEWVREYDLQVTSRERDPQFCGHPAAQRNKNLYLLRPAQLVCPETTPAPTVTTTTTTTTTTINTTPGVTTTNTITSATSPNTTTTTTTTTNNNVTTSLNAATVTTSTTTTSSRPTTTSITTEKVQKTSGNASKSAPSVQTTTTTTPPTVTSASTATTTTTTTTTPKRETAQQITGSGPSATRNLPKTMDITTTEGALNNNPPLLVRSTQNQRSARNEGGQDIVIREAKREESTIFLKWDTNVPNLPGFRVVYRTFGDASFKEGAVLPLRNRKFRMTNVPSNECIIVCVISLTESGNITADEVPRSNCREMRGEQLQTAGHADIDKIVIIAASTAICVVVIIAVIIFVCCSRRRREKQPPLPPPIVSLPPLEPGKPEWDNASAYSSRSIPRARMYNTGRGGGGTVNSAFLPDDARSHISHMSSKHAVVDRSPSLLDGQYGPYMSPHSGHTNTLPNPYPLGRADMTCSTKSLTQTPYSNTMTNNRKKRGQRNGKWGSMSTSGSVHSLNGYDTENGYFHPNPWSGSELDHYPSGNHISQPYNKRDYT